MNLHVDTLLETPGKTVTLYRSTAYVYAEQDCIQEVLHRLTL